MLIVYCERACLMRTGSMDGAHASSAKHPNQKPPGQPTNPNSCLYIPIIFAIEYVEA